MSDGGQLKKMGLMARLPPHQVRNPGIGVLGRPGIALAQQAAQHVADFGQRRDQRGSRCVPQHERGRPPHPDGQTPRSAGRRYPASSALAVHHLSARSIARSPVVAGLQARQQPRQRGLRRSILCQWRRPTGVAAGQLPEWVTAQRSRIAKDAPPSRVAKPRCEAG